MGLKLETLHTPKKPGTKPHKVAELLQKEITLWGASFSNQKKERFYTELAVLLNAGLTLKDALTLLVVEQKKNVDKQLLETLTHQIISGKNFSEALASHKVFSIYEVQCVLIGERTGNLAAICSDLGLFFEQKNAQRRAIIGALSYPIIVLLTAFGAIVFMLRFVVPMFEGIFKQNKTPLPWITTQIIKVSDFFESYFLWGCLFLFIIWLLLYSNRKKLWFKKRASKLLLKTPFLGTYISKIYIAHLIQALSLLTQAKVPLLTSIQLTKKMIPFYPLQFALAKVEEEVLLGKPFHESIRNYSIFDAKLSSLLKVAEETNQNETIFKRLSMQYQQALQHQSKMLGTVVEPLIILFLGLIVAIILIGMYLPMFTLSTVIG